MSIATRFRPAKRAGRPAKDRHIVALIAAHNEEHSIGAALTSLANQTRPPDEVIVVADRCTDRTAEVAVTFGAKVFETGDNSYRKAGALNQALMVVLRNLNPSDHVLLMDADTILSHRFLAAAEQRLITADKAARPVGAVGGIFLARDRR